MSIPSPRLPRGWHRALALLLLLPLAPRPAGGQIRINYQDAELTTVVTALAEMAGLNVVFVGVDPSTRVTLKMGRPVTPEEIPGLLRTILESAGFVAAERDGLLQVLPAAAARTLGETQVFVHPLRHASATEVALTLASVYGSTDAAAASVPQTRRSLSQQLRTESSLGIPPGVPGVMAPGGQGLGRGQLDPQTGGQSPMVGGVMVGEAVVVPYTPTNSLIIRTTPRNFELLRQTIDRLDARPEQVLIEVFVAEVALDRRTEFGVDWSATFHRGDLVRSAERFPSVADSAPGGLVVRLLSLGRDVDVRATLRAVSADSRVNVLATPSILARNNEEARILVGSQVPFTQIARSGLSGEVLDRVIQFRDVGTELAIVPTINQDGYVTLEVLQQVSTLTNQTLFGAPVITVREAQTSAIVQDRQTIVIGGLIDSEDTRIRRGIPILKNIPLLGALFRDTELRGRKTELVIFLTPYLVRSDADAEALRQRALERTQSGERVRREMDRQRLTPPRPPATQVRPDSAAAPRPAPVTPGTRPEAR
ncbi:MAG TPA: secretin N-terminal domain-containing protein [Longimicrobiaceae bacterium]|nr:secretin N-terminal domain-containing protein [Longimicrobiaceae bacterium]